MNSDPDRTPETREHRDELVDALADELLQFAAELHSLPPRLESTARVPAERGTVELTAA